MTYGWAILIIAIVMVALFSLGILGGSPLSTNCIQRTGYECTGVVLHDNVLTASLGQVTGNTWSAANVIYVPSGTAVPAAPASGSRGICDGLAGGSGGSINAQNTFSSGILCMDPSSSFAGSWRSGDSINGVTFSAGVSAPIPPPGTAYTGAFWAYYQTPSGGNSWYATEMAVVTLKAI